MALIKTTSDKLIFKCWIITSLILSYSVHAQADLKLPITNTLALQTQQILKNSKKGLLPLSQNPPVKQAPPKNVAAAIPLSAPTLIPNEAPPEIANKPVVPIVEDPSIVRINHGVWEDILKHYVSKEGLVDYKSLKRDQQSMEALNAYIKDLSIIDPSSLNHPTEVKAAWLNLYNAIALKQIVDAYPISNVLKIRDFFTRAYPIGNKKYSLIELEQQIFAGELHDRRCVFARSYGAKGAPKLNVNAYTGAKIDEQLNDALLRFVKQNGNVLWVADKDKLVLSGFFMFYQQEIGDVVGLMRSFVPEMPAKTAVIYGAFDWSLNVNE